MYIYSLRPEILVIEMDVSICILVLDTSILMTSISERREYITQTNTTCPSVPNVVQLDRPISINPWCRRRRSSRRGGPTCSSSPRCGQPSFFSLKRWSSTSMVEVASVWKLAKTKQGAREVLLFDGKVQEKLWVWCPCIQRALYL